MTEIAEQDQCRLHEQMIHDLARDVKDIKVTTTKMSDKWDGFMKLAHGNGQLGLFAKVEHNRFWVQTGIKILIITTATGLIGGIIGMIFWAFKHAN